MRAAPLALSVLLTLSAPPPAAASPAPSPDPARLCERAIVAAAAAHGTPERLLRALAKVESGRATKQGRRPWPWTVNAGGEGRWFDSKDEALDFARRKLADGVRSIDLGCLQINRIWHGDAFTGLAAMLDPRENADYAARFLARLKAETGDWMRAAGYYHSRTKVHFERYSALVAVAYREAAPLSESRVAPRIVAQRPAPPRRAPRRRETRAAASVATRTLWAGLLRRAPGRLDEARPVGRALGAGEARQPPQPVIRSKPPERSKPTERSMPADRPKPAGRPRAGGVALSFGAARPLLSRHAAPIDASARRSFLER